MKIVHIIHSYYPKIGGIEKVVQLLAEEQAKLGHSVVVITSNLDVAGSPKEEIINNVKIMRLRSRKLFYNDLLIPLEEPQIGAIDVIHVHSQNSYFSVKLANKIKKQSCAQVVIHFMAVDAFKDHPNFFLRLFAPYYGKWLTKKSLKLADKRLVRSLRDLKILKERYSTDAIFLPDGVASSLFSTRINEPESFGEKFSIKQKNFFLFIGRVHKLKGPQVLVEALKYVPNDIAAVFIGPDGGYLKESLCLAEKFGVKERTYFLGFVDETTKLHAIDSSLCLVLPSVADYVEVYPGVMSEAWAREKPVIAAKVGGIPYRIKDHFNGLLVNPSNPKLLASAMLEIARNTHLAKDLGKNGKTDVHSWEKIAEHAISIYQNRSS